jgi:excisionase family DNA binding protein
MSDFAGLLASEMGVSRRTVQRWCEARRVPGAYRTKGDHWRLRRPTLKRRWGRYDDRIIDFVMRYTSGEGYTPAREPDFVLAKKIVQWAERRASNPPAPSADEAKRIISALEWAKMVLEQEMEKELEALTASKEFNDAVEFSLVANEISDDDTVAGVRHSPQDSPKMRRERCYERIRSLKERDLEKYNFLYRTPILKMIHPRAYEAVETPERILRVKAEKLRLNMRRVTPASLADELKISVATLYRRYGRILVRQACQERPVCDEAPTKVRYQIT